MLNHEVLFFGNGVLPLFPSTLLGTCACQQRYQPTCTMRFMAIVCIGWWGWGVRCSWDSFGPISFLPGWLNFGAIDARPHAHAERERVEPSARYGRRGLYLFFVLESYVLPIRPFLGPLIRPRVSLRRPRSLGRSAAPARAGGWAATYI